METIKKVTLQFNKKFVFILFLVIAIILALIFGSQLIETVQVGTYQIRQMPITGTLDAKLTPGMWGQWFGDIKIFSVAETFYFTEDQHEGLPGDQSIEVTFSDGSICRISGTMRVQLPNSEKQLITLLSKSGFTNYLELENKLIRPVVRNALRLTANLMTARESYSEKMPDFVAWAWSQIQNGLYETEDIVKREKDPITGEMIEKSAKAIKKNKDGTPLHGHNPLGETGVILSNFEVKKFVYSDKVKEQIAKQQEAYMAIATAKAKASEAEQNKLTVEAEGKAKVATAQYEKEQEKIRAVVDAEKDKKVAELQAEKNRNVEKLNKDAAEFTKQKEILLGQGEAERKKLVMQADGALKQKLDTYEKVMIKFSEEMAKQKWVPEITMGSGGQNGGNTAMDLINLLSVKTAKDLSLDLSTKVEPKK